jgi:hypothetical protein
MPPRRSRSARQRLEPFASAGLRQPPGESRPHRPRKVRRRRSMEGTTRPRLVITGSRGYRGRRRAPRGWEKVRVGQGPKQPNVLIFLSEFRYVYVLCLSGRFLLAVSLIGVIYSTRVEYNSVHNVTMICYNIKYWAMRFRSACLQRVYRTSTSRASVFYII